MKIEKYIKPKTERVKYSVCDEGGRVLANGTMDGEGLLQIAGLKPGSYMLYIIDGDETTFETVRVNPMKDAGLNE